MRSVSIRFTLLFTASAGLIAAGPVHAVPPGNYSFTIKYQSGQHRDCEQMNGSAEAVVQDGSVKSSLVRSLRLTLEPNGAVTGFGYESITGHGAAIAGASAPKRLACAHVFALVMPDARVAVESG